MTLSLGQEKGWINGHEVTFSRGESILTVARRAGIFIPTLCELASLNHHPGTCRVCLVEIHHEDGSVKIVTSCDTAMQPGMSIKTRSKRLRSMQKLQVEMLFADHNEGCTSCASCSRHGHCELQQVAMWVGFDTSRLAGRCITGRTKDDSASALTYAAERCIRCLRCVELCRNVQGIGAITFNGVGLEASVGFGNERRWIDSSKCVQCGQCTVVCPTGALSVKDHCDRVIDWLDDDSITTVFSFAPAVRVALPEAFDMLPGDNAEGKIISALKSLGADYVMDTRWAADVTIMEEGTEFFSALKSRREKGDFSVHPLMTSCCPGWVNYVEKLAPDMIPHLSSTRSPQAIFGALAKSYLASKLHIPVEKLRVISIMPCTAKKDEAARKKLERQGGQRDIDAVLTVREVARLFKRFGLDLKRLEKSQFDIPLMSLSSGASALFGTTGGVMEAALRTISVLANVPSLPPEFLPVRGLTNAKEATVDLGALGTIRVAVVHELKSVQKIIEAIRRGEATYDFIEVMACPGGCIGGGGTARGKEFFKTPLQERQKVVYEIDRATPIHASHENPEVQALYHEYLGAPGSHLAHELLHCTYEDRSKKPKIKDINAIFKELRITAK